MKNNKGSNNPSWKGGFHKKDGYVFARAEGHPKACRKGQYVRQHVLIYENYLSILFDDEDVYIPDNWVVHHINGIKDDNRLVNLELMKRSEHQRYHTRGNTNKRGKHKDFSNRLCSKCGTNTTRYRLPKPYTNNTTKYEWNHLPWDKVNWYCNLCYAQEIYYLKKNMK